MSEIILPDNIPTWAIEKLIPYENNPRTHTEEQINQIAASMAEFGFTNPILVDKETNEIIAGHGRLMAAKRLGLKQVPVVVLGHLNEAKRRKLIIADNQLALNAGWDMDLLATELSALNEIGEDLDILGFDDDFLDDILNTNLDDESEKSTSRNSGNLFEKFGVPPLSILDGRQGYWQKRKKLWRNSLKEKGESREGTLFREDSIIGKNGSVSLLDPVLCEILLSWFGIGTGTSCIDPFAGDTILGYVCSLKNCYLTGIEIRPDQVKLNREKCEELNINAVYINDDGQNVLKHVAPDTQDLLLSCPPYFNLEVYSNLPNDASNQNNYKDFLEILNNAFSNTIKTLKNNRFAAIVISNVRDKKTGIYYNLVNDIVEIFTANGMTFYNDIVLVDQINTAALRAANSMKTRKVTRTHQNILIFYKGEPENIKENFTGEVFVDNFIKDNVIED